MGTVSVGVTADDGNGGTVAPEIEEVVVALAIKQSTWGQVRVSNALRSRGHSVSLADVRCVWQRHDLENMNR